MSLHDAELITLNSGLLNGTVAEWLGRALQKLLQQFESARYLTHPVPPDAGGIFLC